MTAHSAPPDTAYLSPHLASSPCENTPDFLFQSLSESSRTAALDIARLLQLHDFVLIAAHTNPDGDAMGACAAMGYILQSLGKTFAIYNESSIPPVLDWLPLPSPLYNTLGDIPFTPQLAIILDCGDAHRVGKELAAQLPQLHSINIDHHLATPEYGTRYNWIDSTMAATGQMVAYVALAAGIPLTGALAENIFVALVTDTGSFSYSNTSAKVLHLAAHMLDNGLNVASLRDNMENRVSLAGLRLQGELLLRFTLHHQGKVAMVCVSQHDLHSHQTSKEEIEGVINRLRQVRGVVIAVVLREDTPHQSKISLRSSGDISVRAIAATLGGGGHINASGVTMAYGLHEAQKLVLQAITDYLTAKEHESVAH